MRLAIVIFALTAIAVGLIHMRRAELTAKHEIQCLQLEQIRLRRTLWDQQNTMAAQLSPAAVGRRAEDMALEFISPNPTQRKLLTGVAVRDWRR